MKAEDLKPSKILRGPLFPEPVQVIVTIPMGASIKLIGKGQNTKTVYEPILTPDQLVLLDTTPHPVVERLAIQFAIKHDQAQGRTVESVENENRGFDLISRLPHAEDAKTAIDVRFIEIKGRAATGETALTINEYNTAKRLKKDYWLYVVFHCASNPSLNNVRDPSQLDWQPIVTVEQYRLNQDSIRKPVELKEDIIPYRTKGPV